MVLSMKNERVFVSGGAGVIGCELINRLIDLGAEVLVGDLKPRPKIFSERVQYRQGDLNTISSAELSRFAPTVFIHLAATFERSTESYDFWEHNFWNNVRLSHHLMTLLKDMGSLKKVVFASSYLIYDPRLYTFKAPADHAMRLSEGVEISPRNLTGMAKLAHEIELRFLNKFRSAQFTSVSARIFRGYGRGSRDVISRWIRSALRGEVLTVYRAEGMFDYIYARDTAEGLIQIAQTAGLSGVINLGTGRARRVSEVVDIIRANLPGVEVDNRDDLDLDYEASCADMSLFAEKANWTPGYSLERAIPEIIEFEKTRTAPDKEVRRQNILVSSASRKIPLVQSVVEARNRLALSALVLSGDIDEQAHAQHASDGLLKMPATVDGNLEGLLAMVKDHEIGLIIPTRDGELEFWSRNRSRFEAFGTEVLVSDPDAIVTSIDKLAFAEFGESRGLPIIPAWATPEGSGPFVVKERFGAGSQSIGLRLDKQAALAHGSTLANPIFQPFVEGREISVDAWIDRQHKVKGLVLRERNEVVNGESVVTTTFRNAKLEVECRRALESLALRGPVVLQLIVDQNEQPHIIELNARFGGASTASIAAGLDIWYWSLLEMADQNLESVPFLRSEKEVRQIRVPQDLVIHDPYI